tara:strand:+ start:2632 stop:3393 length:762 start_codon:yes stop_codon:yes gene_type:complete
MVIKNNLKVAIMQPTFLPWLGYFSLIERVDIFVLLDNVQLSKQSWQTRVKVLSHENTPLWISIPINKNKESSRLIKDIEIKKDFFPRKQIRTLKELYFKGFLKNKEDKFFNELMKLLEVSNYRLNDLNTNIINYLNKKLILNTKILKASEIIGNKEYKTKTIRLVDILKSLNCQTYISPPGSIEYLLKEKSILNENKIKVYIHRYEEKKYFQRKIKYEFIPGLSIIDSLAWNGTRETINKLKTYEENFDQRII